MNETIIMRLAWYKTLINSVTYVADTPIGSYEIDVITDNKGNTIAYMAIIKVLPRLSSFGVQYFDTHVAAESYCQNDFNMRIRGCIAQGQFNTKK